MLLGADIGGLGTPVGSLANLIALGLYRKMHPEGAAPLGRYMVIFLVLNFSFLILNCILRGLIL